MSKEQGRYQRNLNDRLRLPKSTLLRWNWVTVPRPGTLPIERKGSGLGTQKRTPERRPKAQASSHGRRDFDGPYSVQSLNEDTVVLWIDEELQSVSRDRIFQLPRPELIREDEESRHDTPRRPADPATVIAGDAPREIPEEEPRNA